MPGVTWSVVSDITDVGAQHLIATLPEGALTATYSAGQLTVVWDGQPLADFRAWETA